MSEKKVSVFKDILLKDPWFIYPVLIILCATGLILSLPEGPLRDIVSRISNLAVAAQWLGIYLSHRKRKKERLAMDRERLEADAKEALTDTYLTYFVEYMPWIPLKIWNKICGKHSLRLYAYPESSSGADTKFRISHKTLFEMKLHGFINTKNSTVAYKGFLYMQKNGMIV